MTEIIEDIFKILLEWISIVASLTYYHLKYNLGTEKQVNDLLDALNDINGYKKHKFKQIKVLPSTRSKKAENVIAEGELAGHTHLLNDGALYEVINSESQRMRKILRISLT